MVDQGDDAKRRQYSLLYCLCVIQLENDIAKLLTDYRGFEGENPS